VAIVPIMGTMAQRVSGFARASGGASTESIGADFDAAMKNPDVGAIVLHVDSPGGSVAGVPELAAKIRAARGQGKRIVAVADSLMASAAYWVASAADEVVASPSSVVGSIGVFSVHTDATAAHEKVGLKRTVIRAGRYKAEGNMFEPLSDEARAAMQAQVNELYDGFVADVAAHRGTTPDAVRAGYGEGRVVSAKQAVAQGLADRVATFEDVLAELTGRRTPSASARERARPRPSHPPAGRIRGGAGRSPQPHPVTGPPGQEQHRGRRPADHGGPRGRRHRPGDHGRRGPRARRLHRAREGRTASRSTTSAAGRRRA
jgi:signal peptide peptidase SppA